MAEPTTERPASEWHRRHQMPDGLRVVIRRTATGPFPWEARCTGCSAERVHIVSTGAAVVNTRGIGNARWRTALAVALRHLAWHAETTPPVPEETPRA